MQARDTGIVRMYCVKATLGMPQKHVVYTVVVLLPFAISFGRTNLAITVQEPFAQANLSVEKCSALKYRSG